MLGFEYDAARSAVTLRGASRSRAESDTFNGDRVLHASGTRSSATVGFLADFSNIPSPHPEGMSRFSCGKIREVAGKKDAARRENTVNFRGMHAAMANIGICVWIRIDKRIKEIKNISTTPAKPPRNRLRLAESVVPKGFQLSSFLNLETLGVESDSRPSVLRIYFLHHSYFIYQSTTFPIKRNYSKILENIEISCTREFI